MYPCACTVGTGWLGGVMNSYEENRTHIIHTKCPIDGRDRDVAIIYRIRYTMRGGDLPPLRELVWSYCNYCDFSSANRYCDECSIRSHEWFKENFQELHRTAIERFRESYSLH